LLALGAHHILYVGRINVKGYTSLDKIRSEVIRKELEISEYKT
jgi:hypothetical protein